MNKKLQSLALLSLGIIMQAQNANSTAVFIGNSSQMHIGSGAGLYAGGDIKLTAKKTKAVTNKGNVTVLSKISHTAANTTDIDGTEFENVYTAGKDYGQIIFLGQGQGQNKQANTNGTTSAKITSQRPKAEAGYNNAFYHIGFPFTDKVENIMTAFNKQESDFIGSCNVSVNCNLSRYHMTLMDWNNKKIEYDNTPKGGNFKPGSQYLLNMRLGDINTAMQNGNISYKGTPNVNAYFEDKDVVTSINGANNDFSNKTYNDWKGLKNTYNEPFKTYMGDANSTSKSYNKNLFKYANPFTSNIDLSKVGDLDSWIKVKTKKQNGGNTEKELSIEAATKNHAIKDFTISKPNAKYALKWDKIGGSRFVNGSSTSSETTFFNTAKYEYSNSKGTWIGSADALIVQPHETFHINIKKVNPKAFDGKYMATINVKIENKHKTFGFTPDAQTSSYLKTKNLSENKNLSTNVANPNGFFQLEILLLQNGAVEANPVYLVGADYYTQNNDKNDFYNKIYTLGINEKEEVKANSKEEFNTFNSTSYIAKPFVLGFDRLEEGKTYDLKFNLSEGSIFNPVDSFNGGVFFLKDKETNQVIKIDAFTQVSFTKNKNTSDRFEIYWQQVPNGSIVAPEVEPIIKPQLVKEQTILFRDGEAHKVRFEYADTKAKVEVYNMAGRLVSLDESVSTNKDLTLRNLDANAVFVIKVTYNNGQVRTLKTIK